MSFIEELVRLRICLFRYVFCRNLALLVIHRMQIWRTARSAPGTSGMKARLVRL